MLSQIEQFKKVILGKIPEPPLGHTYIVCRIQRERIKPSKKVYIWQKRQ